MSKHSTHKPVDFILASSSPRRKELMHFLGLPFIVCPPFVNEDVKESLTPPESVQRLALRKARAVSEESPEAIVLGADTIVVHHGNILGKPKNNDDARSMIQTLSNSTHQVLTGISLIQTDPDGQIVKKHTFHETTRVTFGDIPDALIEEYVATETSLDKAGGYGIQDKWGAIFTKRIEGDVYNVVGLPVHALYQQLKKFASELFNMDEG